MIVKEYQMADDASKRAFMAWLISEDVEGWARLSGLLATLALPEVHHRSDGAYRRRVVEIEVEPDSSRWEVIDGAVVEQDRLVCWYGTNGTRVSYTFARGGPMPRWRTPREIGPRAFIGGGE